jgi:hypothetical protein
MALHEILTFNKPKSALILSTELGKWCNHDHRTASLMGLPQGTLTASSPATPASHVCQLLTPLASSLFETMAGIIYGVEVTA